MLPLGIAASQTNACGRGLLRVNLARSDGQRGTVNVTLFSDVVGNSPNSIINVASCTMSGQGSTSAAAH
jgi:hypothetical protein